MTLNSQITSNRKVICYSVRLMLALLTFFIVGVVVPMRVSWIGDSDRSQISDAEYRNKSCLDHNVSGYVSNLFACIIFSIELLLIIQPYLPNLLVTFW